MFDYPLFQSDNTNQISMINPVSVETGFVFETTTEQLFVDNCTQIWYNIDIKQKILGGIYMFIFADFSKILFGNETVKIFDNETIAKNMLIERKAHYSELGCEIKENKDEFTAILRTETGSDILRIYTTVIVREIQSTQLLSVIHICDPDERELHSEIERFEYELEETEDKNLFNEISFYEKKMTEHNSFYSNLTFGEDFLQVDYDRDFLSKRIFMYLIKAA